MYCMSHGRINIHQIPRSSWLSAHVVQAWFNVAFYMQKEHLRKKVLVTFHSFYILADISLSLKIHDSDGHIFNIFNMACLKH